MNSILPQDLIAFLRAKKKLAYVPTDAIPGRLTLHKFEQLRVGRVYAAPKKRNDPNLKKEGVYRIPAVSLIAKCEHYDPHYLLAYLPFEKAFGAFDGDHARVTLFPGATWSDIVQDPVGYINALWERKPGVKVTRNTDWGARYAFFPGAFE